MTWLLSQMWAILGIAALLGLIFGWSFRGALLRGRLRRAEVERGVAQTELEHARTEIEGLYVAQRKLGTASPELEAEIAERDARMAQLSGDLESARAELTSLTEQLSNAQAAPGDSAAVAEADSAQDDFTPSPEGEDEASLEWRNRYLESRVRTLESELETAGTDAPAELGADDVSAPAPALDVDTAKLIWQNDYLRTRLRVFERGAGQEASIVPDSAEDVPEEEPAEAEQASEPVEAAPAVATLTVEDSDRETPDEELARLRWRNRYLEGRLAYLEEERSKETVDLGDAVGAAATGALAAIAVEDDDDDDGQNATGMPTFVPVASEPVEDVPEFLPETPTETDEGETSTNGYEETPIVMVQPAGLDAARNDGADDLTLVDGIGPRIQDVLNSFGIYHLDQIAEWTPENVAWIDEQLSFDGRVSDENWVAKARDLLNSEAATPSA